VGSNSNRSDVVVVIPAYRVSSQILNVISQIGHEVTHIVVVDDSCPEHTGQLVERECKDPRVQVLYHSENKGVGGAMISGYQHALKLDPDVVVKLDGDGQMNPIEIPKLIKPVLDFDADYSKGNRFFNIETLRSMPKMRLIGNAGLSFFSKLSSGYWSVFDPNNGFTAISGKVLKRIDLTKIDSGYFFESDMLFRLNLTKAVVRDVPMNAFYGDESSSLSILKVIYEFPIKHFRNLLKRVFYNYFLREFSLASLNLFAGVLLLIYGAVYGSLNWLESRSTGIPSGEGSLILFTVTVLMGFQLLVSFFAYDIGHEPKSAISRLERD
jgi:dolichol-phosphate mannosyltransferase